ncbi:MAG: hypothetical protein OHK0046_33480 [Anaerolineae bacterium]
MRRLIVVIFVLMLSLMMSTAVVAQDDNSGEVGSFTVSYAGRTFDGTQTTFTYLVAGTGAPPDLSHFNIALPVCSPELEVAAYSPTDAVSFGTDPTTNVTGIKWDLPLQTTSSRTYSITFTGDVVELQTIVAVKDGNGFETLTLPGPGCSLLSVNIEKQLSSDDGLTWQDADTGPGVRVTPDALVSFRFIITNDGAEPLTNLFLVDNRVSTDNCTLPEVLLAGEVFTCDVGPFPSGTAPHVNTATVTGSSEDGLSLVSSSDSVYYFVSESDVDLPVFIVIEGPVTTINVNIITIYDFEIELAVDNPLLTVLQIGDVIRVEGDLQGVGTTIVIAAINIVFIDIDVFVNVDGQVWRGGDDCNNPPPPWAPAEGWRRRCQGGDINIIIIDDDDDDRGRGRGNDDDD